MIAKVGRRGFWAAALLCAATGLVGARFGATAAQGQDAAQQPSMVAIPLPTRAPAGAVVLLAGKESDMQGNWVRRRTTEPGAWTVDSAGVATPKGGDITSKAEFGDCFVHVEFCEPTTGGGNSGVGLMGRYEVQILNSYGKKAEAHECGALYSQTAPRVIASRPAGQWQTMDIIFRAPRFDAGGQVVQKARATVFQNGILIQDNAEFTGPTGIQYGDFKGEVAKAPLVLQGDHDPVQYRNVWVVPLD